LSNRPSQKAKIINWKWLGQRDDENCLYCKKPNPNVIDHLNNNPNDNRLENYAKAHQSCNIAKAYNTDYSIIAQTKLKENELSLFIPVEDNTPDEVSSEIKISKNNFEIIEQYISEIIKLENKISWDDALYGGTYKCKKITGYGSPQCTRNYLKILTSSSAPFIQTKDDNKKKIIVKRTGK